MRYVGRVHATTDARTRRKRDGRSNVMTAENESVSDTSCRCMVDGGCSAVTVRRNGLRTADVMQTNMKVKKGVQTWNELNW